MQKDQIWKKSCTHVGLQQETRCLLPSLGSEEHLF